MVTAAGSAVAFSEPADVDSTVDLLGAQTLLKSDAPRPHYSAQGAAALLYVLALTGVVLLSRPAPETQVEQSLELVLAPAPVEEPPPPEAVPEQADEIPPPPEAIDPIAPLEQPKPVPKPEPKPKVEKKAERKPAAPSASAPRRAAPVAGTASAPAAQNANLSAIAAQIHARLQRAAANAYPESQAPRSARVGYRVSFNASGALTSFSIVPSGNAAFDAVASRLGGRIGAISPPGKPVSLSGSLTFSP